MTKKFLSITYQLVFLLIIDSSSLSIGWPTVSQGRIRLLRMRLWSSILSLKNSGTMRSRVCQQWKGDKKIWKITDVLFRISSMTCSFKYIPRCVLGSEALSRLSYTFSYVSLTDLDKLCQFWLWSLGGKRRLLNVVCPRWPRLIAFAQGL